MYYHLLKNVLRVRWPDYSEWHIYPDENTSLNWNEVEDFLDRASMTAELVNNLLTKGTFNVRLRTEFRIREINPVQSHLEPLVQLADLFAGLAAYSYDKFEIYSKWKTQTSCQAELFVDEKSPRVAFSCSDRERCQILSDFDAACKNRKLGVSLETHRGLRTFEPRNPINFWLYVPQHHNDLAPTYIPKS